MSFYTSYFIKLFYFVRHRRFKSDFLQNEVFIHFRVWNNIYLLHLSNANLFDKITVSFYILYVIKFLLPATVYSNFISSKTKSPANCSSLSSRKLVKFTHSSYIFKLDFLKKRNLQRNFVILNFRLLLSHGISLTAPSCVSSCVFMFHKFHFIRLLATCIYRHIVIIPAWNDLFIKMANYKISDGSRKLWSKALRYFLLVLNEYDCVHREYSKMMEIMICAQAVYHRFGSMFLNTKFRSKIESLNNFIALLALNAK